MSKYVYDNVAVIIPIYNEGSVIGDVVANTLKNFKYVVCINDGSSDNSAEQIEKAGGILINHPINMGQGAALQTGVEFSRDLPVEYFVMFDADGQHRVEDALAMIRELEGGQYDIILGSRFLGDTIGMKASKKMLLKLAVRFSNVTSGLKLTDTHNGLRAFNRHVANTMQITMPDMTHASEIIEIIADKKYRYKEIPVTIRYTEYSKRKGQAVMNAVNIGFDTLLRRLIK